MGCRGRNSCQPVVSATVCTAATVGPVRQSRGKGARKKDREREGEKNVFMKGTAVLPHGWMYLGCKWFKTTNYWNATDL